MKLSTYQAKGFYPLNAVGPGGLISMPVHAAINIVKGDAIHDDTAGFALNTGTDFAITFMGIAAENCDNSAGAAGDKSVLIIPRIPYYQFSVPVDGNALITRTAVGTVLDLGADSSHVAVNDTVAEGVGFLVEDFDASTEAQDGTTYGYAIGRIVAVGAQA